jgi:hypothetical protein
MPHTSRLRRFAFTRALTREHERSIALSADRKSHFRPFVHEYVLSIFVHFCPVSSATAIEARGLGFSRVQSLAKSVATGDQADIIRKNEEEFAKLDAMLAPLKLRMPKIPSKNRGLAAC